MKLDWHFVSRKKSSIARKHKFMMNIKRNIASSYTLQNGCRGKAERAYATAPDDEKTSRKISTKELATSA